MQRNPNWTRDELILALDLYRRDPSAVGNEHHPAVIALSALLNTLPLRPHAASTNFRNPSGVGMKLANFRALDPEASGAGLKAGGRLDKEVFDAFAHNPALLRQTADHIRAAGQALPPPIDASDEDDDAFEAEEGQLLTRSHIARERTPQLSRRKKQQVLKATGYLACEVCGFDFVATYGEHGEGFAECHHTKPVSELSPGDTTRSTDLAIVCANCHRMLHRHRPWKTIAELKALVEAHRATHQ